MQFFNLLINKIYSYILFIPIVFLIQTYSYSMSFEKSSEVEGTFSVSSSVKLNLNNPSGDLVIQGWDKSLFKYKIIKKGKGSTPEEAKEYLTNIEVKIDSSSQKVKIDVDLPDLKGKGRLAAQVDFEIWLPNQSELNIILDRGSISSNSIFGKVNINAKNIILKESGPVANLNAINGDLKFELSKIYDVIKDVYCYVANGDLEMYLPEEEYSIKIIKANGKIHSDFSIMIGPVNKYDKKTANGKIGIKEKGKLILEVTHGNILLSKRY